MNSEKISILGRPSKDSQSISMEERILLAARKEFLKKGFKAVSMDKVANTANTTKATIYSYFNSKTVLFTRTIVHLMTMIQKSTEKILSQEQFDFKDRLIYLTIKFSNSTQKVDVNNFINLASPSLTISQKKIIEESKEYMHSAIENAFIREMNLGTIPKNDSKFLLKTFLAIMHTVRYTDYDKQPIIDVEKQAHNVVDFFWKGLFYDQLALAE